MQISDIRYQMCMRFAEERFVHSFKVLFCVDEKCLLVIFDLCSRLNQFGKQTIIDVYVNLYDLEKVNF